MWQLQARGTTRAVFLYELANTGRGARGGLRSSDILFSLGFWLEKIVKVGGAKSVAASLFVLDSEIMRPRELT